MLRGCQTELNSFMSTMAPLHERIGQWTIQLPATFGPEHFEQLKRFCALFPADFPIGIEVRHPAFFSKGDPERELNAWLMEQEYNRIIMDSRPIFSAKPNSDAIIDAQKKKPKLPVHAIATAHNPMIRFIGQPQKEQNYDFFTPWLIKIAEWVKQGKQPYLMIHTADNIMAPELALNLYQQLKSQITLPDLNILPIAKGNTQIHMF